METISVLLAFLRGIHRSPVNFPHQDQWRGTLMFSLIWTRINCWVNNREAGDLRRYRTHYDVIVMKLGHPQPYNGGAWAFCMERLKFLYRVWQESMSRHYLRSAINGEVPQICGAPCFVDSTLWDFHNQTFAASNFPTTTPIPIRGLECCLCLHISSDLILPKSGLNF